MGNVKSFKAKRPMLLKKRVNAFGYYHVSLLKNGKPHERLINRLVAQHFIENPFNKPTVNHKDGVKTNNVVKNLEWATREEQMQHAYKNHLKQPVRGTLQGRSVLTEEEVREIRRTYIPRSKEFGMRALAKKYNVSDSTIDKAVRNKSYRNV
jgi:hypothetical protein